MSKYIPLPEQAARRVLFIPLSVWDGPKTPLRILCLTSVDSSYPYQSHPSTHRPKEKAEVLLQCENNDRFYIKAYALQPLPHSFTLRYYFSLPHPDK